MSYDSSAVAEDFKAEHFPKEYNNVDLRQEHSSLLRGTMLRTARASAAAGKTPTSADCVEKYFEQPLNYFGQK